jgi:hypothetical protein
MPLNARNTKNRSRVARGGKDNQVMYLHKRGPDQQQGTVVVHKLFACWRELITRTGQTLQERMTSNTRCILHIPTSELKRVGVNYLTVIDKFYDPKTGDWWRPESDTTVSEMLFGNMFKLECKQGDPNPNPTGAGVSLG